MKQQSVISLSLLLLFLHGIKIFAQSPAAAPAKAPPSKAPAAAPAQAPPSKAPPAGPAQAPAAQVPPTTGTPNVDKILQKAGHFNVFIRLLQSTQEDGQLFSELNTTRNGITIFAPSDNAFSNLKIGTLNSLTDEQKTRLVKFHVIPKFIASSQFQTETNPVKTQAGTGNRFGLNVTTSGNAVNISTGLTNTSISGTVYTDSQLAIYQVNKVLLPLDIFTPKPSAPAPAPALAPEKSPKKKAPAAESPVVPTKDASGAMDLIGHKHELVLAVGIFAALFAL